MSNSLDNAKSASFDPDKLLEFILDSPKSKPLLIAASIACGLINALILVLINDAAKDFDNPELDARLFIIFLLLIALYFLSRRYITHKISRLVQTSIYQYRRRVLSRVRELKLLAFEDIGKAQILSVLSEKTELISHGAHKLAEGFPVTILLIFSFVYIAIISKMAFVLVFICMLCSMISVQIMLKSLHKSLQQALTKEGEYLEYMQHVINGFNELKINRTKSDDLCVNYMDPLSEDTLQQNLAADITIVNVQLYAQNYFYILMAAIVFLLPQITQINGDEIMSVTTSVLYIIGPLVIVLDMIPSVARANVAVDFLRELENKLIAAQEVTEPARETFIAPDYFAELMLSKVVFHYPDTEQSRGFSVGPFDLNIKRGELIFIRGGNGSGKSTFLKLLTGLYEPDTGSIRVDGHSVDNRLLTNYRQLFAIIFTDFHLFDRLYGLQEVDIGKVNEYLELMGLEHKTGYKAGRFINTNLSTGQKKRLALIISLLEDKAIYVFDEVAADQDPEFRLFFYEVILQKLKQQGKTIIVVTHDEKYFKHCDRLFVMDSGRLVEEALR